MTETTDPISVREHLTALMMAIESRHNERFVAQNEALRVALSAAEKAVLKAELSVEKRFDAVNEFRQSLNDMMTRLMPREECDQRLLAITEKIERCIQATDILRQHQANYATREQVDLQFTNLHAQLTTIASAIGQKEAKSIGIYAGWGYVVGVVGFVISLISVAYAVMFKEAM